MIGRRCESGVTQTSFGQSSGIITSHPDYPGPYEDRIQCTYLVRVHNARSLTFYFNDFSTERYKDELSYGVTDTLNPNRPEDSRIDFLWGNLTMLNALPYPVTVSGSQMWFYFFTDMNIMNRGFELVYIAGE